MFLYEKYMKLSERCDELNHPSHKQLKEIEAEWKELTLELFESIDKDDLTDMWTLLDDELCDSNNYWDNFRGYLSYCSDRMNINRWCRLQLLLGNAISVAYRAEHSIEKVD